MYCLRRVLLHNRPGENSEELLLTGSWFLISSSSCSEAANCLCCCWISWLRVCACCWDCDWRLKRNNGMLAAPSASSELDKEAAGWAARRLAKTNRIPPRVRIVLPCSRDQIQVLVPRAAWVPLVSRPTLALDKPVTNPSTEFSRFASIFLLRLCPIIVTTKLPRFLYPLSLISS